MNIMTHTLFIGKLKDIGHDDLYTAFSEYGKCRVYYKGTYAFVEFDKHEEAEKALEKHNTEVNGEVIEVQWGRNNRKRSRSRRRRSSSTRRRSRSYKRHGGKRDRRDSRERRRGRKDRRRSESSSYYSRSRSRDERRGKRRDSRRHRRSYSRGKLSD
jgi:RNA recognition motif-containing protein